MESYELKAISKLIFLKANQLTEGHVQLYQKISLSAVGGGGSIFNITFWPSLSDTRPQILHCSFKNTQTKCQYSYFQDWCTPGSTQEKKQKLNFLPSSLELGGMIIKV